MKSVCVFGDSLAKGVVLDSIKNRYTFLKDSFLSLVSQKTGINFTNYSKFGCDIKKGRDIFLKHKEELNNYDFIFIEFGGNDCNFDWKSISEHPDEVHQPQTSLDEFENTYRGIVKTTEPLSEEQYNNLITKLEKKYNKKIILQQVIDSSILGGIYVRVNNEVMDGTVKLRLEELKKLMVSAE